VSPRARRDRQMDQSMVSDVSFDAQTEVSFDLFAMNNKQYDNSFVFNGQDQDATEDKEWQNLFNKPA
jgi:hypothetical protein